MFAIVLNHMGVRIENLLLIYVVGVVICSVETSSMCWGIGSSVVFVFTFNFLFTAPKFTFQVDDELRHFTDDFHHCGVYCGLADC